MPARKTASTRRKPASKPATNGSGPRATGASAAPSASEFNFAFPSPSGSSSAAKSANPWSDAKSAFRQDSSTSTGKQKKKKNVRAFDIVISSSEGGSSSDEDEEEGEGPTDSDASMPEADEDVPERPIGELSEAERRELAADKKEQGNALFKKGDYPSATRLYSAAIELDSSVAAYRMNRAASLMGSRMYRQALDDCLAAVAMQQSEPQAKTLLRLVRCQNALGLYLAASQTLEKLLRMDASPAVMGEKARTDRIAQHLVNIQREREARNWPMVLLGIDAASKETEESPREWRIWKLEALCHRKRFDQAASLAADLLRADPKQPDVLYYRGLTMYYQGNHQQAIAHAQEALRNDPDFVAARKLMRKVKLIDSLKDAGNDAFKNGQHAAAIEKYTEAMSVDDENETFRSTLLSNRAVAYLRTQNYEKAKSDCNACLEINPTYYKAIRTRARVHLAQEAFDDAVRDFKAALEHAPDGSNDERALQNDVADAEAKLRRSKMKDHYKILGITSTATEVEIKKAYRKQSLIHHPDKGGSEEKFKQVSESYAILSDPQRRRKFDMGIDESDPMQNQGYGASGGVDLSDLFGGMGGGGFHFGGGASPYGAAGGGYGGGNPFGRQYYYDDDDY